MVLILGQRLVVGHFTDIDNKKGVKNGRQTCIWCRWFNHRRKFTEEEKLVKIETAKEMAEQIKANIAKVEKHETDKTSGNQKLKDLGLTDDEIAALVG